MKKVGPSQFLFPKQVSRWAHVLHLQSNPALTDVKGSTSLIFYRRNSIKANIGIKEKQFEGTMNLYLLVLQAEFR